MVVMMSTHVDAESAEKQRYDTGLLLVHTILSQFLQCARHGQLLTTIYTYYMLNSRRLPQHEI